eukprot:5623806-Prymnesium_polylepis.1
MLSIRQTTPHASATDRTADIPGAGRAQGSAGRRSFKFRWKFTRESRGHNDKQTKSTVRSTSYDSYVSSFEKFKLVQGRYSRRFTCDVRYVAALRLPACQ